MNPERSTVSGIQHFDIWQNVHSHAADNIATYQNVLSKSSNRNIYLRSHLILNEVLAKNQTFL